MNDGSSGNDKSVVVGVGALDPEELARATAVLMSFRPKQILSADQFSSDHTSDVVGGNSEFASQLHRLPSLSGPPSTSSAKSRLAAAADARPLPLPTVELHPEQVAFLTSVGEVAKRLALRNRPCDGGGEAGDADHDCDVESPLLWQETKLSIDTLVRTEGQRVRLRFVHACPTRRPRAHETTTTSAAVAGTSAVNDDDDSNRAPLVRRDAALSLCTILASFAPPKASYWQDDRIVEPYLGESYGPSPHRQRRGRGEDSGDIERDEDFGAVDDDSWREEVNYTADANGDSDGFDEMSGVINQRCRDDSAMRSYAKVLAHHRCRNDPVFYNAFFLDTGNITDGERRKKLIVLPSYRASVISFVDKKVLKKDINNDFYVQHPELEIREIKLTHVRAIRADLLNFALEENSPIEVVTVAYANWYFERLIMRGMVGKRNRRLALAACVLLAIKFVETGDIHKKIHYAKTRFRQDEAFAGVTWQKVQAWEFRAYVGLDFTLMPESGNKVVETHMERLLGQINVTLQEYYSKKFALP
ncbi:putative cyclin dependent kinase-binding protein [Trypanosoma grayi]|uniref:putative cyclin dependent kinase-binding protein n=1 Tax=Trypanosoma grayi TaxID=71804 RepID=UPI0004F41A42|nr:putative cyclin dependent kinase-binding protein [Trypanosoma grayi]KEG06492.1 putative cyclin dependent kinase-binding protein [Trypanosoma grayi]